VECGNRADGYDLQKKKNAVKQAKNETVSQVAGKALRIGGGFLGALARVQLSLAGACPALRNTSAILGD
jgi:hypothetical protein